jgi:hypothetical protein
MVTLKLIYIFGMLGKSFKATTRVIAYMPTLLTSFVDSVIFILETSVSDDATERNGYSF